MAPPTRETETARPMNPLLYEDRGKKGESLGGYNAKDKHFLKHIEGKNTEILGELEKKFKQMMMHAEDGFRTLPYVAQFSIIQGAKTSTREFMNN